MTQFCVNYYPNCWNFLKLEKYGIGNINNGYSLRNMLSEIHMTDENRLNA